MRAGTVARQARRSALLAGALLLLHGAAAGQSSFDEAVAAFHRAWRAGDADAVVALLQEQGIQLQLGSETHSRVAGRQARAAIAAFRGSRAQGTLDLDQARESGGDPPKGSAQFRWQTVVQGTSETVPYTIFLELTRTPSAWRISAIRVF